MLTDFNDGFNKNEMKASYWLATHRVLLRKILIFSLLIVVAGLFFYGFFGLLNYYFFQRTEHLALEQAISQNQLDYQALAELNQPQDLQIVSTKVLQGSEGHYDILSEVNNPNEQWAVASFDYYYLIGEESTASKTNFILPGESKFILYLNYPSASRFSTAELVVENIKWEKVANYFDLAEKVLQFEFSNQKILSATKSSLSQEQSISNVRFDVLNKSAYSFWDPRFVVFLYSGNNLVAVTQVVLDSLSTGEQRSQSINLFQSVGSAQTLKIFPDINILNPDVFKGFANGSGELK